MAIGNWRLVAATIILMLTPAIVSSCGDDGADTTPTPGTIIEGNAVQIFLREAYKVGWFTATDSIEVESEPLNYEEALAEALDLDLSLYPTVPGGPPYPDGLPGWLITARGEFYDNPEGAERSPETPRRPAIAAAFVDRYGGLAYSMRFTDVTPAAE